jgi:hypothetical protein
MPSRPPAAELRGFVRRLPWALLAALVLWTLARPAYDRFLCGATRALARAVESPPAALVVRDGDHALLGRSDLAPDAAKLRVSLTQVHFNLVPFLALTLALPGALAGGRWRRLLVALAVFAASHVLALFFQLLGHYALSLGAWSLANVSPLERNVVGTARLFFDIVVAFGLPFVAWATAFRESVARLAGLTAAG